MPNPAVQNDTSHDAFEKDSKVTFAYQEKLEKLPIPPLEETCQRYLSAVKPLLTARQFADTEGAVNEFLHNEGPELQEALHEYASQKSSYIEQFWYDSYLNYDNPVVLNLNPFFVLEDDPTPSRNHQVPRAASLVSSALCFVRALRREELPPDQVRGQPLDMYQYTRLFGTSRIPTEQGCIMQSDNTSSHIVVMCRSQFYWFDVLDENHDVIISESQLASNFEAIKADAHATPQSDAAKAAVGVLSTENRRVWARLRNTFTEDIQINPDEPSNKECLKILDSSLFVVCLDDIAPHTASEISSNFLCGTSEIRDGVQVGTCTNRWYDKLQIIVTENGTAGVNFEHTGVDGHTVLRFVSDIYTDTIMRYAKSINPSAPTLWPTNSPDISKKQSFFNGEDGDGDIDITPRKLEWTLTGELRTALRFAETRLSDLIQQNEVQTLEFTRYGSNFIKRMGFSPDAFVQMAFQAAYYGLYGSTACTYEPAMTKAFLHGRTEAIRSVTDQSVEFTRKFCEDYPAEEKVNALRKACENHVKLTRTCSAGLGQDRHLYALFCIWRRRLMGNGGDSDPTANGEKANNENRPTSPDDDIKSESSGTGGSGNSDAIPAIFNDVAWDKLNTTIISSSNCGNPSLRLFGFGPVSAEGFGIGYIIKDNSISICASSKHRQTSRFLDTLQSYLLEVRGMLRHMKGIATPAPYLVVPGSQLPETPVAVRPSVRRSRSGFRSGKIVPMIESAIREEEEETADENGFLGGYGFFDMGSLETLQTSRADPEDELTDKKAATRARRRSEIGRRLRLVLE
ncbi:acyltransferase ChoActase/COT/CPT [Saitoella complicata NRRL Y-17804]|nr:acyltransferase ChoActase/COT/CPT [Saitoella complicata NRRL Y-17804]ODQ53229.1 acyltransferase ChoActase/COT/CPT [Saitoella complicata NRRL Y-17804]